MITFAKYTTRMFQRANSSSHDLLVFEADEHE